MITAPFEGFPDGAITIPVPATCPELANIYNAPLCAFDHELTHIPMRMDLQLQETGGEVLWVALIVACLLIAVGGWAVVAGAERIRRTRR